MLNTVYIIGSGPGDAKLITVRGTELLAQADVVIYDFLVNKELLQYCRRSCETIYAGKRGGHHSHTQEDINMLMAEKVKGNKTVVRLKGGDPLIFGRGGEEALFLTKHNIPFEIVPGITAGIAAPAYAGIPPTQRGYTSTITFVTGHEDPTKKNSDIDWQALASGGTLVFYMGVKNLPVISRQLIAGGRAPQTPAALIQWGTYNNQVTVTGTLESLVMLAQEKNIKPPAIVVIGDVVALRKRMQWFDNKPLFGKKIVVTRSRKQASTLSAQLKEAGAYVIEFPTIDIQPADNFSETDNAIHHLSQYGWIVFTSVNGVNIFFERIAACGYDARHLNQVNIAVIGTETGKALKKYGIRPDLVPERYTSEGTVEAFRKSGVDFTDVKVLLPSSHIARDYIPEKLKEMGAVTESIPVYKNHLPEYSPQRIREILSEDIDMITFTSSSTVNNFVEILIAHGKVDHIQNIRGASIGPITSATARQLRVPVAVEATKHTIPALSGAIIDFFSEKQS